MVCWIFQPAVNLVGSEINIHFIYIKHRNLFVHLIQGACYRHHFSGFDAVRDIQCGLCPIPANSHRGGVDFDTEVLSNLLVQHLGSPA